MNKRTLVLIVTWNGAAVIRKCLDSLRHSTIPLVTYIVDNNSEDNTTNIILDEYPDVILKMNSENIGFGQANNMGFKYALENGFGYVMMLNQDTYIEPDAIQKLVEVREANPTFGLVSPMHFKAEGQLDGNFYRYIVGGCSALIHDSLLHPQEMAAIYPCGFINAAAWLLSVECIQKVGGFNPVFFHTGEDVDYFNRVSFMGFQTGVVPKSIIYHTRSNWGKLKGYSNPYLHRLIHYEVALLDPRGNFTVGMVIRTLLKEAFCQFVFGQFKECREVIHMTWKLWKKRSLFHGSKTGYVAL